MTKEKICINCWFVKNMQTLMTGLKCNNQDSDMYGEYVDNNTTCKKFELWEEIKPEEIIKEKVQEIAKANKASLREKIEQSRKHYEERLAQEIEYKKKLTNAVSRIDGRIEIIIDIIDDLKHDLEVTQEV